MSWTAGFSLFLSDDSNGFYGTCFYVYILFYQSNKIFDITMCNKYEEYNFFDKSCKVW